jgi:hypothetical protein
MSRRVRAGSAAAERLLDGDVADASALSRVLAAARAPGRPEEVAGLDAARAAFMRAMPTASRPPASHRPTAPRTAVGRLLTLKAIAAVGGATLAGGAAYAASTGGLLGGPSGDRPGHHAPASPSDSWNPIGPTAGAGGSTGHLQPTASLHNSKGKSAASSARAGHNPPNAPASSASTRRPSSTPTPTPTGHARTTPPEVPSNPAGTHSVHTTPPGGQ